MSLHEDGWELLKAADLGWDLEPLKQVIGVLGTDIPGKLHARDVVTYTITDGDVLRFTDKEDNYFHRPDGTVQQGVPRFSATYLIPSLITDMIWMVSDGIAPEGEMHFDAYRTFAGVEVRPHQDTHAEYVFIVVIDRRGPGGVSYLDRVNNSGNVLGQILEPGDVLVFRDPLFWHGVTAFEGDYRDVLVATIAPRLTKGFW